MLLPNIRIVEVKEPTGKYYSIYVTSWEEGSLVGSADAMIEQAVEVTALVLKDGVHTSFCTSAGLITQSQMTRASFGPEGSQSCSPNS